jgi:hypothetical protein
MIRSGAALFALLLAGTTAAHAAVDEPAPEVPLVLPKIKRKTAAASQPASQLVVTPPPPQVVVPATPPPPPSKPVLAGGLHIGAKAYGFAMSGALRGGAGGEIEIGYRLPFAGRRLGLMLHPAFSAVFGDDTRGINGWWLALPLGLSYHEPIGRALFRVSAAVSLDAVATTAQLADGPARDMHWTVGAAGGLGFVLPAGPGGIVLELRYRLLAYVVVGERFIGHGGTASVGYSFFL